MSRVRVVAYASWALAPLLALGCRGTGAERIVGPDGTAMAHVHCGRDQASCFRIAGEMCPAGYEMQPVLSGRDGNFLLRCRNAGQARLSACPAPAPVAALTLTSPAAPPASAPVAADTSRNVRRGSPNDGWPPSSEPWPAEYPWPPPEASVTARPKEPLTPTPKGEGGQVDVGY